MCQLHRDCGIARDAPGARTIGSMRVVLVGGAGEVGAEVARDLAHVAGDRVARDRRRRSRTRAAAMLARGASASGSRAPAGLDVHDRESALAVARRAPNVLMNCTSFTLFDAVLDAGRRRRAVDYADLISEPTTSASARGRARPGSPPSPAWAPRPGSPTCWSAMPPTQFDELHDVEISWISSRTVAPTPGLLDTILWEAVGGLRDAPLLPRRPPPPRGVSRGLADASTSRRRSAASSSTTCPTPRSRRFPRHFPTLRQLRRPGQLAARAHAGHARARSATACCAGPALDATKRAIWERWAGARDGDAVDAVRQRRGQSVARDGDASSGAPIT